FGLIVTMGFIGVVVDGASGAVADAEELDLPIFCKATTVAVGNKHGAGVLNVPVTCGGVVVESGDIVACDADGVVVVPKVVAETVLKKAIDKEKKDEEREARIGNDREKVIAHLDKVLENK